MEKPVRRKGSKGSFLRSLETASSSAHDNGDSKENVPLSADVNETNDKKKESTTTTTAKHAKAPRTYHISATAAIQGGVKEASDAARHSIYTTHGRQGVEGSESGDVDLSLSFDFVSTMEGRNDQASSSSSLNDVHASPAGSKGQNESPRGMSKADWGSRSRKKPPTPLSLGRKQASLKRIATGSAAEGSVDLTSQFSPDSPTKTARTPYDEEPLTLLPLSASRRAADAGVQGPASMTALINEQRSAAARRQLMNSASTKRHSPIKRNAQGAIVIDASPTKSSKKAGKAALGENKSKTNAQIEKASEQDEVVIPTRDDVPGDEGTQKRDSVASFRTAPPSSTGHDSLAMHQRQRGLRSRQTSEQESSISNHSVPQSFRTTATSKSVHGHDNGSSLGGDHLQSVSPSAENVLGLLLSPEDRADGRITTANIPLPKISLAAHMEQQHEQKVFDLNASSMAQTSSPFTPISPLYSSSESDERPRSSLSSAGGHTPATAISTLFEDRTEDRKVGTGKMLAPESASMMRGLTAPIPPPSSIAADVIREESTLSIERPASVPPHHESRSVAAHSHASESTDFGSEESAEQSSLEEPGQKLVVSTLSSPEKTKTSFDLTQVTGTGIKKGPWSESPLLLDNGEETSPKSVGLGLFVDGNVDALRHAEVESKVMNNYPDLIVHRAELAAGDLSAFGVDLGGAKIEQANALTQEKGLAPPASSMTAERQRSPPLPHSASQVSAGSDGFAINITPPAPVHDPSFRQPDHRVDVPSNIVLESEKRGTITDETEYNDNKRWSSKLWSMTSAFRSPIRTSFSEDKARQSTSSPPMRALTLVSKQTDNEGWGTDAHRRSRSRNDAVQSLGVTTDEPRSGYHTVPTSAVIPANAHFESISTTSNEAVTRPQLAMYSETRSSRHVQRPASRIRYVNEGGEDGGHIRLDMDPTTAPQESIRALEEIKSPRVAASPSGMTPKMQFLANVKNQRRSWTTSNGHTSALTMQYETTAGPPSSSTHAVSPWLAPKRQSYTGARDSELYNLASNVQALLAKDDFDEDAAAVETILGDEGLRRRANHRPTSSVPNTPTFVPNAWTTVAEEGEGTAATVAAATTTTAVVHDERTDDRRGPSVMFQDAGVAGAGDGRRSRMNFHRRPLSGMSLLLYNVPGIGVRHRANAAGVPSSPINNQHAMHVSSSMPYLHLHTRRPSTIGRHRSSRRISGLFTAHDGQEDGFFAYSGKTLQNASASQTLFFAGFLLMPWLWFIGGWALDDEGRVLIEHEKAYGAPFLPVTAAAAAAANERVTNESDQSHSGWYDDEEPQRSEGIHSSAQAHINHDDSPFLRQKDEIADPVDDAAMNRERLYAADDAKFWRRMSKRPASVWHGLRHARNGMGGEMQRKQEAKQMAALGYPDEGESSVVRWAREAFDWRKLDSYVVANRVMAMLACIIVLGGMGVAIAMIVVHWH